MKATLFFLVLLLSVPVCSQVVYDVAAAEAYQKQLNVEYTDPNGSPLLENDLKHFSGLDFFKVDARYIVRARLLRTADEKPFEMKTTGARRPMYVKFGEAHFEINGKSCTLNIYRNIEYTKKDEHKDALFLPFSDLTSGSETYIGGRYIELTDPKTDVITIDFNRAYNPYCAYNPKYSCPIVPLENDLKVAIYAGVKKFHD